MDIRDCSTGRVVPRRAVVSAVGLAALTFAGCGAVETPKPTAAPTTSSAPSPAPKPTSAGKPAAGTALPSTAAAKPATKTDDLKALEEAAKREGQVVYYGSLNPGMQQELVAHFQQRYGIKMDAIRLASGPLSQRYAAEADARNVTADIVQLNDPVFFDEAVKKQWLGSVEGLPSLEQFPKQHWYGAYGIIAVSLYTAAYNTSLVKESEVPNTWAELVDPKWKGQLLFIDPRNTPAVLALTYLFKEQYGADFLRRLANQDLRLVASGVPGQQQLAAGAGQILFPGNHDIVVQLQKEGAPVADKLLEPATGAEQLVGISAKPPHPNAARLLLNFLLSVEGQSIIARDGYISVLPNVPGSIALPKTYRSPKMREAIASRDELVGLLKIQ